MLFHVPGTPFPSAAKTHSGVTADTWPQGQSQPLLSFGVYRHASSTGLRSLCLSGPRNSEMVGAKCRRPPCVGGI